MKKLALLLLAVSVISFTHSANGQSTVNPKLDVFNVGTTHDTAVGNATKHQISPISSGGGITVSYAIHQLNDSCAGAVSIWGSIDNVTYFPYPGADSVAITAATNFSHGWYLATSNVKNPVKWIDVRTRLTSTYTVGKATVKTKVFPY